MENSVSKEITFSESSDNRLEISVGTEEISAGKRRVSSEAIIKNWDALCVKRIGKMQGSDERGRRCEKELKRESQKALEEREKGEKLKHERREAET